VHKEIILQFKQKENAINVPQVENALKEISQLMARLVMLEPIARKVQFIKRLAHTEHFLVVDQQVTLMHVVIARSENIVRLRG
jgi:hypothetical protein